MGEFTQAIVITGGIASGKSTVSTLLKLHGYTIICLDDISHKVIETIHSDLVDFLGGDVIKNGKVDRKAIGNIVFNDKEKLRKLESLLHPKIKEEAFNQAKKFEEKNIRYFLDIPLYFEGSSYEIPDVLVVYTPRSLQVERGMKRDGFSEEEINARIDNQLNIEEKREKATWVIDNSKDINFLTENVNSFVNMLKSGEGK